MRGLARFERTAQGAPTLPVTLTRSQVYEISIANACRGMIGGKLSRATWGFEQRGRRFAVYYRHQGSTANSTQWNATFAGYEPVLVQLADGDRTDVEVAEATRVALLAAGAAGITRVGGSLAIAYGTNKIIGPAMTENEAERGMYGAQRSDFGTGTATLPVFFALDGELTTHVQHENAEGRIIALYVIATAGARTGNLRMAISNGPAFALNPGPLTDVIEGLAVRGTDTYIFILPEPMSAAALANKYITLMTNAAAGIQVSTRPFAANPVGAGNLTVGEANIYDTTSPHNPDTDRVGNASGVYTPIVASNANVYTAVGYIFERPDASGDYYGRGNIRTKVGYHGVAGTGGATFGPTVLDGLSDTPRLSIPASWRTATVVEGAQGAANVGPLEDFGYAFYDCSASNPAVYPFNVAPTRLQVIGPIGAQAGAGFKTFVCNVPLAGISVLGMNSVAGNLDGSIPATVITIVFTPQAGAGATAGTNAWLLGWIDDRETWDDMVPERGGLGVNAQYVTVPGGMPAGNPYGFGSIILGAVWPALFLTAPPAGGAPDLTGTNHPQIYVILEEDGIT
jgi:hypothetical protein